MSDLLRLHPDDNVAFAVRDLDPATDRPAGFELSGPVQCGHKLALREIPEGAKILKYGHPIGQATRRILAGDHVHSHNLAVVESESGAVLRSPVHLPPDPVPPSFLGYARASGSVGTRNYVGVLTTVNCSATVARMIAERAGRNLQPGTNVDGIVALTHATGCGMSASGEGIVLLRRTLAGFARHPNFSAVLIVGLGCEANQIAALQDAERLLPNERTRFLSIQDAGGTSSAIEQGTSIVRELVEIAGADRRTEQSTKHLTLGLQCGGSDAWSGVSANPALGLAADQLVKAGGSVILAETPEIYGAESLLLRRAVSDDVAQKLQDRLEWWQDYVARNGQSLDNNPSPGNLAGGLTTILEKSLGAVAKAGSSPLVDVLLYGEAVRRSGLSFMDSPGYDPCSVTGEIAAGANLVAFTTGRGSVFGAKPVPSIKIASNDVVAAQMAEDIDLSAGGVVSRRESLEEVGSRIFELLVGVASGQQSASERLGFGDLEFVPWQLGAVI